MKFRYTPQAIEELRSSYAYLESERRGLGAEFAADVRLTLKKIAEYPLSRREIARGIRQRMTERFSYHVIYRLKEFGIEIIAISHTSRKPRYWKDRLK